ncbi:MAG: succinylglutamate desuccinylase/aspartoacylase family protein [Anaerolineae bacterium]|nr:succinylglutamate desuccinylase/aspartoacylase family protein [Anaerolineae bacterium]
MSQIIYNPAEIDFDKPGKSLYEVAFHYDGEWGYAMVPLAVINGTAGPLKKNIVAFGGTHGNEYEGQVAVWKLMHELDPNEISGRVILLPRLNQPACVAGRRDSPKDNGNMNRAFPGNPHGSITFRIADFVNTRIFPLVDVVLDIHAAGRGVKFAICTSFHLIKDPTQYAEIKTVASLFDTLFVMIYSQEMARGLLTDQAEALGKVTIGGEFGHSGGVHPIGVRHAYRGIKNVLKHYGVLPGEIERVDPARPHPPRLVSAIHLDEYIPAPITGYFEPLYPVGVETQKGQLLGYLYDFEEIDRAPIPITASVDGYLLMQPFQAPIRKGETAIVIGQPVKD